MAVGPKECCGVFGVFGHPDAAKLTYFGLYALQHRGQESAGIVASDGKNVVQHIGMGLVSEVFNEQNLDKLRGDRAIGHVRYSTTGSSLLKNAQPMLVQHGKLHMAIAHNGNLVNSLEIRSKLEQEGHIFQTTIDSEIFLQLLAKHIHKGLEEALVEALKQVVGAYSLVIMTQHTLIAARDPHGLRPLCLGMLNGGYVVASESCALDLIEAQYLRDIEPGEILMITEQGLRSLSMPSASRIAQCIFEFIYFARPDSTIFGHNVYTVRKNLGHNLVKEYRLEADLIMPFPDSGNYAALGYAEASGIPFEMGVIRNHYVGRTFIQPSQSMREFGVRIKLNPVKDLLKGKRVVVIEDSIIRGTTTRTRIKTIRAAGAREVHMLVSCPPHRFPCYYGIDFSNKGELIASNHSIEEIRRFIGLDSLRYLSLPGLISATETNKDQFCLSCFDGNYPTPVWDQFNKYCLET
jgi:amidophosphoribosyltransferase